MRLLLDTHIWLWSLGQPARLSKRVAAALTDEGNELWLSPVSVWETLMLAERGRIALDAPASDWVDRALRVGATREAPLTYDVAVRSVSLKLSTQDPADRFIAATAAVLGLTLVTSDNLLAKSKEYAVLAN